MEFSMNANDIETYLSPLGQKVPGRTMIPNIKTVQTISRAYQQICTGEEPWIALGNFRNAWYGYALFHSQQGQSHHERWVSQMRRVQDKVGIARNMPMAYDKRTCIVANQHLLARQQRRLEVRGGGKSGCPQVVDTISNAMKQVQTRRAESGTTHRCSLGNGTGEKANIDCTPKARGSADPAQKSVFPRNARGCRGIEVGRLWR